MAYNLRVQAGRRGKGQKEAQQAGFNSVAGTTGSMRALRKQVTQLQPLSLTDWKGC